MQLNQAQAFQVMAHKDYRALENMTGDEFDIEIFGFHAQQAVEKSLKAWIRQLGGIPPLTHNISILLTMLDEFGHDVSIWHDFVELNTFAVQFRYEEIDDESAMLDRPEVIRQVGQLLAMVDQLVGYSE